MTAIRYLSRASFFVFVSFFAGAALASPQSAADQAAQELASGVKASLGGVPELIAVMPFELPEDESLGTQFYESFLKALLNNEGLPLVDRGSLDSAVQEASVDMLTGDSALMEMVGAFGADVMITGEFAVIGVTRRVTLKALAIVDGSVLASSVAEFAEAGQEGEATTIESLGIQAQLRRLADLIAGGLNKLDGDVRYQRFAVMNFEEVGSMTQEKQLGTLVAAELLTLLKRDHNLMLVERS
ncbi:hypothetical protein KAI87_10225, partial [Myxococcota bacterium]|nr:hypothetical protein [Myxococcota bacterium]